ncbi:MAG: hybrid sensor histidine kinase/response regulator, partial [Planctomycetota bacterium]
PARIEGHIEQYLEGKPKPPGGLPVPQIPAFFSRKRMEEELRQSERQYRGIFEASSDAFFILDTDGIVVDVNPAGCVMHGKSRQEMIGHPARELAHLDSQDQFAEFMREVSEGEFFQTEAVELRKDGTSFDIEVLGMPFDYQGKPHILAVIRDITERKRAEKDLRLTQFAVEHAADATFWIASDARFLNVNEAACRALGYSREELLQMTVHDIDPQFTAERWPGHWEELKERKSFVVDSEHRTKDGRIYPVEIAVNYVEYSGKEYNFAFARDVTERKRLEDQLRQSQKMEAVGSLAGGIAHDFNNLLTAISGYSTLLLRKMVEQDPLRRKVEEIGKAASRATALTGQLLAFSKKQVIEPRVLDLNHIVFEMGPMLDRLIGEDIELVSVLVPDVGNVRADRGQIEQVVLNLAVNARDAMPEGGRLTIETANVEVDEEQASLHIDLEPGPHVALVVADTGAGMDEETRDHVFEPFFTTKGRETSTGLGLSTVYGIVQQSEGSVSLTSRPGEGTTFTIRLPRVDEPVDDPEPEVLPRASESGKHTILLVEDEMAVRDLVEEVLESEGHTVLAVSCAETALEVCDNYHEPIDLLLTDVVLRGMNGADLADQMTARKRDVKVLFMSGYTDDVIAHRGVLPPDVAFIAKPFSPESLLATVREVLEPTSEAARSR